MSENSLWGDLSDLTPGRTPFIVMQEQASFLKAATDGLLIGRASRELEIVGDKVRVSMDVVAPALENYFIEILEISYDASRLYPVRVRSSISRISRLVSSESELKEVLSEILTSDEVRTVIGNLISESQFSRRR